MTLRAGSWGEGPHTWFLMKCIVFEYERMCSTPEQINASSHSLLTVKSDLVKKKKKKSQYSLIAVLHVALQVFTLYFCFVALDLQLISPFSTTKEQESSHIKRDIH